jgi:exodeoxyribonuclease V gamma subunit
MENLLLLLNKISEISPLGVFNQDVIVVQNAGMQHWLNLAIANERGISMNVRYALPAQFLWKLIRTLASDDKVPEQSPYSREVLTWRIHALLGLNSVIKDVDFAQATQYWHDDMAAPSGDIPSKQAELKRYQLATQMADLFEQYLIFRPQWLDNWQQGNFEQLDASVEMQVNEQLNEHKWQGKLWQLLIEQLPYNPVELLADAIAQIKAKKSLIPPRISFFGLNTMAPMWLEFINALSEHVEVHFFHLNPCFAYWGDIISEKQALARINQWSENLHDEAYFVGNPLLASLGQQGREFLAMLQDYSTVDIELFEQAQRENAVVESPLNKPEWSVLHQLQDDILMLSDARIAVTDDGETAAEIATEVDSLAKKLSPWRDDSIVITSCHSALREVQGLHDYLLHQFNRAEKNGTSLTPKDILVMCPQIEQYAPYVNAVFTRGWQDVGDDVPPLPCSIADRSAKDSDPLVAAFIDMLALPDSRFQVSPLLALLRIPAIGDKFAIGAESLDKISVWLSRASVHWGLDVADKQHYLGEQANNSFTWQQGLSRLLRGFAFGDSEQIYQEQLLLDNVEGDDATLLGQLMLFIEQLQYFSLQLDQPRNALQWQSFLMKQVELLFSRASDSELNSEASLLIIEKAISGLVEHCHDAHFNENISLTIILDYLSQHFSQGDASKQFMVGQVTFCSMLPMRSIPFKIIAVLGLNDGEFPRQRQPLGFDLMSLSKAQLGDRSRRGDDRYLFLEAIISARQALYLSYQGRNIKNNNEKQPSIVLKELMDYLAQGYGWQFDVEASENGVYQLPMQAFSLDNYRGEWPSFDRNWLTLAQGKVAKSSNTLVEQTRQHDHNCANKEGKTSDKNLTCSAHDIIRFYQHPAKTYGQQQLNLYLDNNALLLEDVEPFSIDHLQSYLLREALLTANLLNLTGSDERNDDSADADAETEAQKQIKQSDGLTVEQVLSHALHSGKFPDLPSTKTLFADYQQDSEHFSDEIISQSCQNPTLVDCQIEIALANGSLVTLTTKLPVKNQQLVHYRSSTAKAKDLFSLYLQQLILQIWQEQNLTHTIAQETDDLFNVTNSVGFYFNTKAQKVEQYQLTTIDSAKQKLVNIIALFLEGQQQPLLLNGNLAAKVFTKVRGKAIEFDQEKFIAFWQGDLNSQGFGFDAYLQYFWPTCPDYADHQDNLQLIYHDIFESVTKISAKSGAKQ